MTGFSQFLASLLSWTAVLVWRELALIALANSCFFCFTSSADNGWASGIEEEMAEGGKASKAV